MADADMVDNDVENDVDNRFESIDTTDTESQTVIADLQQRQQHLHVPDVEAPMEEEMSDEETVAAAAAASTQPPSLSPRNLIADDEELVTAETVAGVGAIPFELHPSYREGPVKGETNLNKFVKL